LQKLAAIEVPIVKFEHTIQEIEDVNLTVTSKLETEEAYDVKVEKVKGEIKSLEEQIQE
jgi:hypothetical protein